MRSFIWQLLMATLLSVELTLAQGGPPPWFDGHKNGHGPPNGVDTLAGSHWNAMPGPKMPPPGGQGGQFGGMPPWATQPGGGSGNHPGGAPGGAPGGTPNAPQGGWPGGQPAGIPGTGAGSPPAGTAGGNGGFGGGSGGGECNLQQETGFPGQPTKATMYTYVPKTFKKGNPVVVALHHCGGTGPGYFKEYPDWPKAADQKGFMMIFASSPGGTGGCWDVSSKSSLKHDGGGDTQTIAEMVKYAKTKYGCSDHRVYVVGHSSGAMLTQALGATYPDVFLAGAAYSGVPAGCFHTDVAQGASWNATCSGGHLDESPAYWKEQARQMYPGFTGPPPMMMLVHGKQDQVISFNDHREAVKQWTSLHNLNPDQPTKKYKLDSQPNYEVSMYGSSVMAIAADGVTHDNPAKVDLTCQFFGL
ncbi:related to acetylxylan esterase [Ustilago trichophora]|uniref:Carboxylic ester hydrolase n=1 Tax=Ustilago trichophora TaxID=86804 RepID=A0A5C3EKU3_9BASI|nr:related to acetylxylan esterase [Ustilago trichophora]